VQTSSPGEGGGRIRVITGSRCKGGFQSLICGVVFFGEPASSAMWCHARRGRGTLGANAERLDMDGEPFASADGGRPCQLSGHRCLRTRSRSASGPHRRAFWNRPRRAGRTTAAAPPPSLCVPPWRAGDQPPPCSADHAARAPRYCARHAQHPPSQRTRRMARDPCGHREDGMNRASLGSARDTRAKWQCRNSKEAPR
jgi:hypothetical protein